MKLSYVCTRSFNMGDIDSINAEMGVLGYAISDSGRHTSFWYPDIQLLVEITKY